MICENCIKDLNRDIVARTGTAVNCLAYCCYNTYVAEDGYCKSRCEPFRNSIMNTVLKWTTPRPAKNLQPERLNPETHDFSPSCYCDKCNQKVEDEIKRCDSLNTMET